MYRNFVAVVNAHHITARRYCWWPFVTIAKQTNACSETKLLLSIICEQFATCRFIQSSNQKTYKRTGGSNHLIEFTRRNISRFGTFFSLSVLSSFVDDFSTVAFAFVQIARHDPMSPPATNARHLPFHLPTTDFGMFIVIIFDVQYLCRGDSTKSAVYLAGTGSWFGCFCKFADSTMK